MSVGPNRLAGLAGLGIWALVTVALLLTGRDVVVTWLLTVAVAAVLVLCLQLRVLLLRFGGRLEATARLTRKIRARVEDGSGTSSQILQEIAVLSERHADMDRRLAALDDRLQEAVPSENTSLPKRVDPKGRNANASDRAEFLLRPLADQPGITTAPPTESARRINALLRHLPSTARYLEIGLAYGYTFEDVEATERWGVDPRPTFSTATLPVGTRVFVMTSDAFFSTIAPTVRFDVAFIDGLHTYTQTYLDLLNVLRHSSPSVAVLVDDVVPSDEVSAIADMERSLAERERRGLAGRPWHGDVFKLVPILRDHHPELAYRTIMGSGNPQALVWRADPARPSRSIEPAQVAKYSELSYAEVFGDGVPDDFNPRDESEAIREAADQLRR
jgi:hypothetical protein